MCVHAIFVPRLASMLLGPAPPGRQRLPVIHNGGLCHFKANDSILIQKKKLTAGFEKKIDCRKVSLGTRRCGVGSGPLRHGPFKGPWCCLTWPSPGSHSCLRAVAGGTRHAASTRNLLPEAPFLLRSPLFRVAQSQQSSSEMMVSCTRGGRRLPLAPCQPRIRHVLYSRVRMNCCVTALFPCQNPSLAAARQTKDRAQVGLGKWGGVPPARGIAKKS